MRGTDPEEFRASVSDGVEKLQEGGADVVLVNMQYSPRTESIVAIGAYADNAWVSREREVPVSIASPLCVIGMTPGSSISTSQQRPDDGQKVHDCLGRALGSTIIDAANLEASRGGAARRPSRKFFDPTQRWLRRRGGSRLVPARAEMPEAPSPAAAPPPPAIVCGAPAEYTKPRSLRFNHVARRLLGGQPVTIVAVGSSSTAGAGASSPAATYPSHLKVELFDASISARGRFHRVQPRRQRRGNPPRHAGAVRYRCDP